MFDSGLIGEGIFHILAAAKEQLATRRAVFLPASARVFAQPIQMRVETVAGFDVQQANRWRWRPDYEGLNLECCRDQWLALGDPVEVFVFDFAQTVENMRPQSHSLEFAFSHDGVFNAVAVWFELQLDEEEMLSTSPHRNGRGPTWQQAIHWVQERRVRKGESLDLVVSHDTYAISFKMDVAGEGMAERCDNNNSEGVMSLTTDNDEAGSSDEPKVPLYVRGGGRVCCVSPSERHGMGKCSALVLG